MPSTGSTGKRISGSCVTGVTSTARNGHPWTKGVTASLSNAWPEPSGKQTNKLHGSKRRRQSRVSWLKLLDADAGVGNNATLQFTSAAYLDRSYRSGSHRRRYSHGESHFTNGSLRT